MMPDSREKGGKEVRKEGTRERERRVGQPVAIAKSLRAKATLIIQISQYSKN